MTSVQHNHTCSGKTCRVIAAGRMENKCFFCPEEFVLSSYARLDSLASCVISLHEMGQLQRLLTGAVLCVKHSVFCTFNQSFQKARYANAWEVRAGGNCLHLSALLFSCQVSDLGHFVSSQRAKIWSSQVFVSLCNCLVRKACMCLFYMSVASWGSSKECVCGCKLTRSRDLWIFSRSLCRLVRISCPTCSVGG